MNIKLKRSPSEPKKIFLTIDIELSIMALKSKVIPRNMNGSLSIPDVQKRVLGTRIRIQKKSTGESEVNFLKVKYSCFVDSNDTAAIISMCTVSR